MTKRLEVDEANPIGKHVPPPYVNEVAEYPPPYPGPEQPIDPELARAEGALLGDE